MKTKWTDKQTKIFRDLYANGAKYDIIAIATGKTVSQVRNKYLSEKKAGNMQKLSARRFRAKLTANPFPVIEMLHEGGLDIARYHSGYAFCVAPQVTARAGGQL